VGNPDLITTEYARQKKSEANEKSDLVFTNRVSRKRTWCDKRRAVTTYSDWEPVGRSLHPR